MPLSLEITTEQKIKVTCNPTTAAGNPAAIDGSITVSVISGNGTFSTAGLLPTQAYLISSDEPGDTTYLIEADADLGQGVVLLQDTVTLTVLGAMASNMGLAAAPPELK